MKTKISIIAKLVKYCISYIIFIGMLTFNGYSQDLYVNFNMGSDTIETELIKVENLSNQAVYNMSSIDILHIIEASDVRFMSQSFQKCEIYPNPTDASFFINFFAENSGEVLISIIDAGGRTVFSNSFYAEKGYHKTEISGGLRGFYYVIIKGDTYNYSGKISGTAHQQQNISLNSVQYLPISEENIISQTKEIAEYEMPYTYGDVLIFTFISTNGNKTYKPLVINSADEYSMGDIITFTINYYSCRDYELREYGVVEINDMVWMAENLNTEYFTDNISIKNETSDNTWQQLNTVAYCDYQNNTDNSDIYGKLYNWYAVDYENGICPDGWHVPSDADWLKLERELGLSSSSLGLKGWRGNYEGCYLKATGTEFWSIDPDNQTNAAAFFALPAGMRTLTGEYQHLGDYAAWWTATASDGQNAWSRALRADSCDIYREDGSKTLGLSVRCVYDEISDTITPIFELAQLNTTLIDSILMESAYFEALITDDGGTEIYEKGFVWDTISMPEIGLANQYICSNNDALAFSTTVSGLLPAKTYYVRAYARNVAGISYGNELNFSTLQRFYVPGTGVTDIDDNFYNSVIINGQEWMAENLRTSSYNDGSPLNKITDAASWASLISGAYCWNEDDSTSYDLLYGKLYNFESVRNGNICPTGWHVPTDNEWKELETSLGMTTADTEQIGWRGTNQGGMLKEIGLEHWLYPNQAATNQSGMNIRPAGFRDTDGNYQDVGSTCYYWTTTNNATASTTFVRMLSSSEAGVYRGEENYAKGSSIRCLKNYVLSSTLYTNPASEITTNSAICGGEVTDAGGGNIFEKGLVYAETELPELTGSMQIVSSESGLGLFTDTITDLFPSTTYYVRSYAINESGVSYGPQITFSTLPELFTAGSGMTDYDGNIYSTIVIGPTEYTTSNLRTSRYNDGTPLLRADNMSVWTTNNVPMYCWYNDDSTANEQRNGKIYNQYAVNGGNLCQTGWHVASDSEWKSLEFILGMSETDTSTTGWRGTDQGAKLKEYGNTNWTEPNLGATNQSGYSATGSGYRLNNGNFAGLGDEFCIWTSTSDISSHSYVRKLKNIESTIYRGIEADENGFSVRCVKSPPTTPVLTGGTTEEISINTAVIHGNAIHDSYYEITEKGIVWNSTGNPDITNYDGKTNVGPGTGEIIAVIYDLLPNTEYYVRTFATNSVGTAYGDEISFTTLSPLFAPGPGVTDSEGNTYATVIVNGQEWMAENLKSESFQMGKQSSDTRDTTINENLYGRTYRAFELMQMGGCPEGWIIAGEQEWQNLEVALGMTPEVANSMGWRGLNEGGKLKEPGFQSWNAPNSGATNETGLNIKAGGFFDEFQEFFGEGNLTRFWTSGSDTLEPYYFYARELSFDKAQINRIVSNPESNYYVRCVKPDFVPIVFTKEVTYNEYYEYYSGGTIYSDGNSPITAKGVVWSQNPNPTLMDNSGFTDEGANADEYISEFYELNPGEVYYARAYATNEMGTGYGNVISFTVLSSVQQLLDYGYRPLEIINMGNPVDSLYGKYFDEGLIISIDLNDGGGLLCSPTDLSTAEWGCSGTATGANGFMVGTGKYNTFQIVASCQISLIAADICKTYNNGGYSDWYLPSQEELSLLFENSQYIPGLTAGPYWSSTESLVTPDTYAVSLENGVINDTEKSEMLNVRAVRHFDCEPVFDYEETYYPVLRIGSQNWMGENLRTAHFQNGDEISYVGNAGDWLNSSGNTSYSYPNDYIWDYYTYGALYNSNVATDLRNPCPVGWHVPTNDDWNILINFLGGELVAGGKLKNEGTGFWMAPNAEATNISGFNAFPAGYRTEFDGNFLYFGESASYWTSTGEDLLTTWNIGLNYYDGMVTNTTENNGAGLSIRCVKD